MNTKALCAALCVLCLGALPAAAGASTHPFLGVAASGTPIEPPPPLPATLPFDDACGVAVDPAGGFYVSSYHGFAGAEGYVAHYDANGTFLGKIASPEAGNSPCDLAVDSSGRLYANLLHRGVASLAPSAATIDPERSTGVAVGPDDRIYVVHRDRVCVYPPGGGPLALTIGLGALTDAYGVAVAPSGRVYVGDAGGDTVKAFDPLVDPAAVALTITGAGSPTGHFTDLADTDLAVVPASGNLLVVDNLQPGAGHPLAALDELDPAGAYVGQISHWTLSEGSPPKPVAHSLIDAGPSGVALDSAGKIYLTSGNEENAVLYGFGAASVESAPVAIAMAGGGAGTVTSQIGGISSSSFTGIDCGQLCATEYELGTTVTFVAAPKPHSTFAGWSIAGNPTACSGLNPSCRINGLFAPTEITATFAAIPQRTLTVTKGGSGEGTVSSSPFGLDCGATCVQSFDQNSKVTLAAEAAAGSEFVGWSGACAGAAETCKVTLGANATVSAEFRQIPHVTVTPGADRRPTLGISVIGSGYGTVTSDPGGIDCGSPCSGSYAPGTTITLTATPDPESHFAGWSGCDSATANRCTLKLGSSRTVSANFAEGGLLELGALKLKATTATLQTKVAAPGTLSASAKLLKPVTLKAKRAGNLSLPLTLNKKGKKALAKSKSGRLSVKVTVTFKPSGSSTPVVLSKTATFKRASK